MMRNQGKITLMAFVAVAAMALSARADKIVAWGDDTYGEVSSVPAGNDFTAIAGGTYGGYALKADGSIVAWGYNGDGEVSDVPSGNDFTAIAGGAWTGYALEAAPNVVPAPAAWSGGLVLLSLGGFGVILRRRRSVA